MIEQVVHHPAITHLGRRISGVIPTLFLASISGLQESNSLTMAVCPGAALASNNGVLPSDRGSLSRPRERGDPRQFSHARPGWQKSTASGHADLWPRFRRHRQSGVGPHSLRPCRRLASAPSCSHHTSFHLDRRCSRDRLHSLALARSEGHVPSPGTLPDCRSHHFPAAQRPWAHIFRGSRSVDQQCPPVQDNWTSVGRQG